MEAAIREEEFPVTFAPARGADAIALGGLWVRLCREKDDSCDPDSKNWVQNTGALMASGAYVGSICFQKTPVGFVDGVLVYEPERRVEQLIMRHAYLEPRFRGMHLGQKMYMDVVAAARERGVTEVVSHDARSQGVHNKFFPGTPMQHLYELKVGRFS